LKTFGRAALRRRIFAYENQAQSRLRRKPALAIRFRALKVLFTAAQRISCLDMPRGGFYFGGRPGKGSYAIPLVREAGRPSARK
jgi:hypothetical protein